VRTLQDHSRLVDVRVVQTRAAVGSDGFKSFFPENARPPRAFFRLVLYRILFHGQGWRERASKDKGSVVRTWRQCDARLVYTTTFDELREELDLAFRDKYSCRFQSSVHQETWLLDMVKGSGVILVTPPAFGAAPAAAAAAAAAAHTASGSAPRMKTTTASFERGRFYKPGGRRCRWRG
jgi:hypothetical protein